jgi:thymidine kinase
MINLYLGSMKSSKTSKLFEILDQAKFRKDIKKRCLVRPSIDNRMFITRGIKTSGEYDELSCKNLLEIKDKLKNYNLICIDEGQFIEDLGVICNELSLRDIEIYIAALNGDSDMKPWNAISNLIPFVDSIERVSGICENCGKKGATFSSYNGKKENQTEIGDKKYSIYCRKCWNKFN